MCCGFMGQGFVNSCYFSFTCNECLSRRGAQRKPNRYVASKLPQNKLSEHIERRVNGYIKRTDTTGVAGHVHIRVVYSGDKTVEVRPGMKAKYVHLLVVDILKVIMITCCVLGLLIQKKCLRPFHIEQKHFLPLRKSMGSMCAFLVFMYRYACRML